MERIHRILVLIQILSILFSRPISANDDDSSVKLHMFHRHSLPGAPETNAERLKEFYKDDVARHSMIAERRRSTLEGTPSAELKMFPGSDFGNAEYFVNFNVGSPFQRFALVVDTGSDLTWMHCRSGCGQNCTDSDGRYKGRRVLVGDRSGSFEPIACSSEMCKTDLAELASLTICPTPTTPCAFEYSYMSQAKTSGFFVNETVAVFSANGEKFRLSKMLIGCSQESEGPNFNYADGVLGLAYSRHALPLRTVDKFGGKFSYCLVDHMMHRNATNYLVFGSNRSRPPTLLGNQNMRYTALDVESSRPFYLLNVVGFSLDNQFLTDIPSMVWDVKQQGGVMIDSGMSLTFLPTPAYRPVIKAFEQALAKYERVDNDNVPMKYCFNSTGVERALLPKFVIHFADKARFEPHVKSYVIQVDAGVSCLGFMEASWPNHIGIGNILQQNHLWEYDLIGKRLGFAPSMCRQ